MKLVVRVKLLPSPEQAKALQATLRACNEAAEYASQVAQATGARTKYALQEAVHHELKARFGLSAQPTVRVLGKVCDAYTTRQANLKAGNLGRKGAPRAVSGSSPPRSPFDPMRLNRSMIGVCPGRWTPAPSRSGRWRGG